MSQLKSMREEIGLKQSYVAHILKVNQTTVSRWESGERKPPVEWIPVLAKLYEKSIVEMVKAICG